MPLDHHDVIQTQGTTTLPYYEDAELTRLRKLLNTTAQDMYPQSGYPGDCYIFEVVLGIDPNLLPREQVITKNEYKTAVLNENGSAMLSWDSGQPVFVTRKYTPEQRTALVEWWDLLSLEIRGLG